MSPEAPKETPATGSGTDTDREVAALPAEAWLRRGLVAFFFVYVTVRAFTLAITNDELGALLGVYRSTLANLITFQLVDAQNHPLSGFLGILFRDLLPASREVFAIRLPSLLAFLAFAWGAYRLTGRLRDPRLRILGLAALLANAFALDFFSLARGYALALAFQMISLVFLVEIFLERRRPAYGEAKAQAALWAAAASVISHLAFLSYFVATTGVLFLLGLLSRPIEGDGPRAPFREIPRELLRQGYLVVCGALLGVFYLPIILLLKMQDLFYFGGTRGWVADSVRTLLEASLYRFEVPEVYVTLAAYGAVALGLYLGGRAWLDAGSWQEPFRLPPAGLFFSLLAVMAAFSYTLHFAFGVRFVQERAALSLLPPALGLMVFAADRGEGSRRQVLALGLLAYTVLGFSQLNLHRTHSWEMSSDVRELVADLEEIHRREGRPMVLGMSDSTKYTTWFHADRSLSKKGKVETTDQTHARTIDWLTLYSINAAPEGAGLAFRPDPEGGPARPYGWLEIPAREDSAEGSLFVHTDTTYLLLRKGHGPEHYDLPAEPVKVYGESGNTLMRIRFTAESFRRR